MRRLLSLPPNAVKYYYKLNDRDSNNWFCTSDPLDKRLGSGSGTTWLLEECYRDENPDVDYEEWLSKEKRILIHAGGQSRRVPAYAAAGKTSIPIPVFRWARGQQVKQELLSLQMPLYENIMRQSPPALRTLIVSGDVYIHTENPLQEIPEADIVCLGLWVDASLATRHGVFASSRETPGELDFMLQKPSLNELENLSHSHFFLMDIGIWLLSDRAVELLRKRSYGEEGTIRFYNLYGDFGLALGSNPAKEDEELNRLSVKILPLEGGDFHHFGTSREMIVSTLALQNKVYDQRLIMHRKIKPHPAIFTQNAVVDYLFTEDNGTIWIENSHIHNGWQLSSGHVITGVPENRWEISLPEGICIDIIPVGKEGYVVRPYGIDDNFKGVINSPETAWMGAPLLQWVENRGLTLSDVAANRVDIQTAALFPHVESIGEMGVVLSWMIDVRSASDKGKEIWLKARRFSADELMEQASLPRLYAQREMFLRKNYPMMEKNYQKSIFYQLDLSSVAEDYARLQLELPPALSEDADRMQQIHNRMLRSRILGLKGDEDNAREEESEAFHLLRKSLIDTSFRHKQNPRLSVMTDQIVWGRSPARIDLAGGWTDTPPFALYSGGKVVNMAIELNGLPPLQVYVKPCPDNHIVLRSIDMGATEIVRTFEDLQGYRQLGSPFSIPKAALALSGFLPRFSARQFSSLEHQLKAFGSGIEVSLLSAIPAGSGLGTSSILAATVLGALNDFCSLGWSKNEIGIHTLVLEQLLTSGGGWQDQYGGILHGVKLLETEKGFLQKPQVNWLPDYLFSNPEYKPCHILYYTGITRVAKSILGEIVRGMFLNSNEHLAILHDMKMHAREMSDCIQHGNFTQYGKHILKTWEQKKKIDSGTNPPDIQRVIDLIKDYSLGYKLPGAGGGGFLYMVAKDPDAAARIRKTVQENRSNERARFVEMQLSKTGFQVSRS
jgi:galactokinase/mevalonate kinase-like predicted kinase